MLPANKIQNLTNALNTMRTKLLAAFAQPVNEAGNADNAQKLNGLTIAQMKQQVQNRLNDHLGTNSHGLTAEMLGTYQKGDINVKVNNLLARADLPMSLFRATAIRLVNKNQIFIDGVVICLSGLTFSQATGFSFTVPTLLTNNTYYLTASLSAGSVVFGVTQSPLPENEVNMWIATFTVNSSNNQTIPFSPIVRYGSIRRSGVSSGSSFLSTTKNVNEPPTKTIW